MNTKRNILYSLLAFAALAIVIVACEKEPPLPENPYDGVDYGNTNPPPDTLGRYTITGIHRDIFAQKCANPGCHDGNFEPDFRTPESSFRTLVYAPLIKTDSTGFFKYRVQPGDTTKSWLHERLVTDDQVLGRMPLYSPALNADEMDRINTWILNGAPNTFGILPTLPNEPPSIEGFVVLNPTNQRVDTIRQDGVFYNPMLLQPNTTYRWAYLINDDSTALNQLTNVRLLTSTSMDNFTTGITSYPGFYLNIPGFQVWIVQLNTSSFTQGQQVFFRFYCNDGDQPTDSEFPRTDQETPYKTYSSFIVQ